MSRSNSANAATSAKNSRPTGVVVSMGWSSTRRFISRSASNAERFEKVPQAPAEPVKLADDYLEEQIRGLMGGGDRPRNPIAAPEAALSYSVVHEAEAIVCAEVATLEADGQAKEGT